MTDTLICVCVCVCVLVSEVPHCGILELHVHVSEIYELLLTVMCVIVHLVTALLAFALVT